MGEDPKRKTSLSLTAERDQESPETAPTSNFFSRLAAPIVLTRTGALRAVQPALSRATESMPARRSTRFNPRRCGPNALAGDCDQGRQTNKSRSPV